jgi:hypothetical protein
MARAMCRYAQDCGRPSGERSDERADPIKLEAILAKTVAQRSDGATADCPMLDILDAGRPSD